MLEERIVNLNALKSVPSLGTKSVWKYEVNTCKYLPWHSEHSVSESFCFSLFFSARLQFDFETIVVSNILKIWYCCYQRHSIHFIFLLFIVVHRTLKILSTFFYDLIRHNITITKFWTHWAYLSSLSRRSDVCNRFKVESTRTFVVLLCFVLFCL